MFICNECGFVSREKNIKSCQNPRCHHHQRHNQNAFNLLNPNEMNRLFNSIDRHMQAGHHPHLHQPVSAASTAPISTPPPQTDQNLPNDQHSLGFATVPNQTFDGISSLDDAMKNGTLFPSLHMPYNKKIINRGFSQ